MDMDVKEYGGKQEKAEKKIEKIEAEIQNKLQIIKETEKNQHKFDSKLTPLLVQLGDAIRQSNLSGGNRTQIGLDVFRYKFIKTFKEIVHYLKQITLDSIEEGRLTVSQLEYAIQMILDIDDRVHTYNQQSQLAVYLNAIDSTNTNNPDLTQLQNVIKMNLICTEYNAAIKAITLFAFPFADIYLADLRNPRNLCDDDAFNVTSDNLSAVAFSQITKL